MAIAIFWTYLWRSTLLTIAAMSLVRICVRLMYGIPLPLGGTTDQLLLALVSLPTWFFSLKWAIEKHWPSLSAVEEADKKLRQRLTESQE